MILSTEEKIMLRILNSNYDGWTEQNNNNNNNSTSTRSGITIQISRNKNMTNRTDSKCRLSKQFDETVEHISMANTGNRTVVHSVGQKFIGLKFSKSRTGSDVRYSCHHNSSPPSRSFTVQNKQPSTCPSWLVVACKVTYPSRLHNRRLYVYPHPSCLR